MDEILGLFLLVVYALSVVALATGVTWLVVKLFPTKQQKPAAADEKSG
jgi:hypothetical protein